MNNKLYDRRKELGLTLEEVGDLCGVGKSTVRKWENGMINNMGRDKIVLMAKALQVSPIFILQSDTTERVLSKFDNNILSLCDKLNAEGKAEAIKRIEELALIEKYQKTLPNADILFTSKEDARNEFTLSDLPKSARNETVTELKGKSKKTFKELLNEDIKNSITSDEDLK